MRILFYLFTILFTISFIYIIKTDKEIFNIVLDKKKEKLILIMFCFMHRSQTYCIKYSLIS